MGGKPIWRPRYFSTRNLAAEIVGFEALDGQNQDPSKMVGLEEPHHFRLVWDRFRVVESLKADDLQNFLLTNI
jgi:hypothetical protein